MAKTKTTLSAVEFRQRMAKPPVAFVIEEAPAGLTFGRKAKASPYRDALLQLREASTGVGNPVIVFAEARCEQQIKSVAKKMSIRVLVAIEGGKLYVKIDKPGAPAGIVRAFLAKGPAQLAQITDELAANGLADVIPVALMQELSKAGHASLQSATNGRKEWALTPEGRAVEQNIQ